MTTGELPCLISFASDPLSCSEQAGIETFKMKIFVSSGIRTHAMPRETALWIARPRWLDIKWCIYSLTIYSYMNTYGHVTMQVWNRLCFGSECKVMSIVIILADNYIEIRNVDLV